MEEKQKNGSNKLFLGVSMTLAAVLLIWFLPWRSFFGQKAGNVVTEVDPLRHPVFFPLVPMNGAPRIIRNYNVAIADGRLQATRVFVSRDSIDVNFEFYKNFLASAENGWMVLDEVAGADHRAIFAKNKDGMLTMNLNKDKTTTIIDISFTTFLER